MSKLLLSKKHPKFTYESYSIKIQKNSLVASFIFKIEPNIVFRPKITFSHLGKHFDTIDKNVLNNLIFHLGLSEIPSYWKSACSPEIIIEAGELNREQINFLRDLLIKGLGEFYYVNKIDFTKKKFLKIISNPNKNYSHEPYKTKIKGGNVLVPIGGGKDSIVTLEAMKNKKKNYNCLLLNPTKASLDVVEIAGCKNPIIVQRYIDKRLLKLNKRGYLNGHTPFSAYLAFVSVAVAILYGYKEIALSNEKSANEGNVRFHGYIVNHQYSKSLKFEKLFNSYSKKYLADHVNYFSFLRPLNELQIAKLFSKYPQYFSAFRSCNQGSKKGIWCNNCSKCLFAFTILYPYLEEVNMEKIFGENLFKKPGLLKTTHELLGVSGHKPFDCVGTYKETAQALSMAIKKTNLPLPYILSKVHESVYVTNDF